jgi:cobalt-zinc-cadmium efflux system protein
MTFDYPKQHTETDSVSLLLIILGLRSILFVIEFLAGWHLHSFSLLAVAGHLFVDIVAILIALLASRLAKNMPNNQEKIEAWGALLNGVLLLGIAAWIGSYLFNNENSVTEEASFYLLGIACLGLIVKGISAKLIYDPSHHNLNLRGVFFHAIADAINSLTLIVAFFSMVSFGWLWVDQVASLGIISFMVVSAGLLLRESIFKL